MFASCGMNCKVFYKHCYHKKPCLGCFKCLDYSCKQIKNLETSYHKRYQTSFIENNMGNVHFISISHIYYVCDGISLFSTFSICEIANITVS